MRLLDLLPNWALVLAVAGLTVLALEIGYRLSRGVGERGEIVTVQSAVIGLAGLLLAFSFSLAEGRFDARRLLVVKEANAIGTMYLRAGMVPEPMRTELRSRLRRYVDLRLELVRSAFDPARFEHNVEESNALQRQMWSVLEDHVGQIPPPVVLLSTEALNAVIDVSSERFEAGRTRVPGPVLLLLLVVILAASVVLGYQPSAIRRSRLHWFLFAVPMLFSFFTVVDFDSPRAGLIQTSQRALTELRATMQEPPPPGPSRPGP